MKIAVATAFALSLLALGVFASHSRTTQPADDTTMIGLNIQELTAKAGDLPVQSFDAF